MNEKLSFADFIFAIGGGIMAYIMWKQGHEALIIGVLMFVVLLVYYLMLKNYLKFNIKKQNE